VAPAPAPAPVVEAAPVPARKPTVPARAANPVGGFLPVR
jgi:hypothetical protein